MIYRFGRFELDERAGELREAGKPVAIQPKPFALLRLLLAERDRVVSQDEIFEALWPGTVVTSGSVARAVSHARRAIGDTRKGELLRSLPRRGYRFVGDVIEIGAADPATKAETRSAATKDERAERPARPAARRRVSATDVFVGREEALSRLAHAWEHARRGPGRLVVVRGEAGVGKSRLVEVFAQRATEQGALVTFGRSRDGEGVPAFWLWSQILRELAAAGHVEAGRDFEGLLSDLRETTDAEQRFRFFASVAQALVDASREQPLVLVLEDLQWARSPSLRLLEHLCFELADSRLLLIATVRSERRDRGHPVDRSLEVLHRREQSELIELTGLSRAAIGHLLEQVMGRPAPTELTSELFARTEGVPLFVREAVRLLEERGELQRPERVSRRGISLPRHAVDLIHRKLEGLSSACAELVAAGAVLGREFTVHQVAHVAELDRDKVLDLLEEAVAAGVVEEARDAAATWRFTHALFQEAAYDSLQAGARARSHARAAARLERQHAENPGAVIAELAHHLHQSIAVGDPERAFECAILAAEEASRVLAYEQATVHYEQAVAALDHFETIDPVRRLSVLNELGEAHRRSGDRERRRQVSAEAMESARSLGRTADFGLAAIRFCDINEWSPKDEAARAAVDEALQLVDEEEGILRARLGIRRAYLRIREPDAIELAREAAQQARTVGDPQCLQEALYVLLYAMAGPDHLDERRSLGADLVAAALQLKSADSAVIAMLDIASDHLALGDPVRARRVREDVGRLIGDAPSLGAAWHTRVFDAGWALQEGRIEDVEQTMADALLLGTRLAHPYARICYEAQLMQLHRYRRDYEAIEALVGPDALMSGGSSHWPRTIYARNEIKLGRTSHARELFDELARFDFADFARTIRWIGTMVEVAHLCADLEDAARAEKLIELLAPVEHLHGVMPMAIVYAGPASHGLARLHEGLGDVETAVDYYDAALESTIALGARPMQARIQRDMARPLARCGDSTRAAALEAEAASIEEQTGCRL